MISSPPTPVMPKAPMTSKSIALSLGRLKVRPENTSPIVTASGPSCSATNETRVKTVNKPIITTERVSINL